MSQIENLFAYVAPMSYDYPKACEEYGSKLTTRSLWALIVGGISFGY